MCMELIRVIGLGTTLLVNDACCFEVLQEKYATTSVPSS